MLWNLLYRAHEHRQQMDRRRFESAHMKYAALKLGASYPKIINLSSIRVQADITETITNITPALFCAFKIRYAGTYIHVVLL